MHIYLTNYDRIKHRRFHIERVYVPGICTLPSALLLLLLLFIEKLNE